MKIICTQENLNKGLGIVSHIAGKNISLPILNNILIRAKDGLINLISTNLDIGIKTVIRGKVEKEGELTVQAKLLFDYINLIGGRNINLIKKESDLVIETEGQKTVVKGQEAEEYPIVPEIEEGDGLEVDNKQFKQALTEVVFSAAYDDTRPEISGVLFVMGDNKLTIVATDSYRLAEKVINISQKLPEALPKIIPLRVLQEVMRILEEDGEIKIYFNENQVVFKTKETTIISRLIEGNYPDYKQIIPDGYKTKVEFDRNEMIKLVKAASLFSKAGINDILLQFESDGIIKLSAANVQLGENESTVKAEFKGDKNKIVFNFKYLLEGLQNMPTKKVVLEMISADAPAILRPKGEGGYLYLIMPIRQ